MKTRELIINSIRIIGDIIFVNLAFLLAFKIRFGNSIPAQNYNAYMELIPYISIFAVLLFQMYNLYSNQLKRRIDEIFYTFIPATFIMVLFVGTVTYLTHSLAFPRSVFFISFPVLFATMVAWRYLTLACERLISKKEEIIIVGRGENTAKLIKNIAHSMHKSYNIKDVIIDNPDYLKDLNYIDFNLFSEFDDLEARLMEMDADIIFIASNLDEEEKKSAFYAALEKNWEVSLVPEFYEIMLSGSRLEQIGEMPVFEIIPPHKSIGFFFKRMTDIFLAAVGLILSLPLTLPAAAAVKIESKGPLFFTQERVSRRGEKFEVYKFRTMINNAEKNTGPVLAKENDCRVTKVGKFLRKTRIDEIPQLLNVLKGDMSIVGPRPERPHFVGQFEKEIPHYKYRHFIKTGITGLAQVHGFYDTDAEDKLRMDLLYANKRSFIFDLKILLETLKVIFMGHKAN
jgi:exopolysaccharide biosynthesis polyprenyl glycosylphosphotransferase